MKKVNYHTHTRLCRHAGGAAEDYAAAAWQNSLDVLGFSDHAPFPDGRFGLRMQYDELEPYIRDLNRLIRGGSPSVPAWRSSTALTVWSITRACLSRGGWIICFSASTSTPRQARCR